MMAGRQRFGLQAALTSASKTGFENSARIATASDVAVSALTLFLSAGLWFVAIRGAASGLVAALYGIVVCVPLALLSHRFRSGGEAVVPFLLLIAVAVGGPVGAAGCTAMALVLWLRRPDPLRLQDWYEYIAGVGQRSPVEQTYAELASARLPTDFSSPVHRFDPILSGTSLAQQQRVLGLIGRNYHPDFHATLKRALRNRNILIRAQAAAIASLLSSDDKTQLWRPASIDNRLPDLRPTENAAPSES